jgi:hypothetical protein
MRKLLLSCATLVAGGCGGQGDRAADGGAARTGYELADLAAIGYAGWDAEAAPAGIGGVGGAALDAARAMPGLTLYADDVDRAFALALDGTVVHAWTIPGRGRVEHVAPLGRGRLVAVSVDEGVTVVDRDSNELWSQDLRAHHDVAVLADGALLVPEWVEREHLGRRVRFDRLVRVTPAETRVVWDSFARLAEVQALHPPLALDVPAESDDATVYDYYHLNTVERLGETALSGDARFAPDNLLVCLRNANLVAVLQAGTYDVVWSWRPGTLDMPHTPRLTPAGTLLIFDNGRHRGWSRLVEVDPRDGAEVWSWRAEPREAFFSDVRGAVQRLANGNTLVTESERGRAFELDPAGSLVWAFENPERRGDARKRIYRARRWSRGELLGP